MDALDKLVVKCLVILAVLTAGWLWLWPHYRVWKQGMEGQALLRRAEQEKQILVQQALAEKEAAELRADAIRAVGEMAQKYPEYRMQEFMGAFAEALKEGNIQQVVYVPTEANLPIVEARDNR